MRLIRRYRLALGLTQEKLGRLVGLTKGAVCNWETGRTLPSAANYPKLARVFGISPLELTRVIDPDETQAGALADGSAAN